MTRNEFPLLEHEQDEREAYRKDSFRMRKLRRPAYRRKQRPVRRGIKQRRTRRIMW